MCPWLQPTSQPPQMRTCSARLPPTTSPAAYLFEHLSSCAAGLARRNTFYQTIYSALTASLSSPSGAASALRGEPLHSGGQAASNAAEGAILGSKQFICMSAIMLLVTFTFWAN